MTRTINRDPKVKVELFNLGAALDNIRKNQRSNFTSFELVELEHAGQAIQRVIESTNNLPVVIEEIGS
jgi:hypothetical protein